MPTITDPPTPVNDSRTAETSLSSNSPAEPRIEIHEAMLSPFADADHARWMIGQLFARGWTATYQTIRPRWSFNSYQEAALFRRDFDEVLLHAAPAFVWPVEIYDPDEGRHIRDFVSTVAAVDAETLHPTPFGDKDDENA